MSQLDDIIKKYEEYRVGFNEWAEQQNRALKDELIKQGVGTQKFGDFIYQIPNAETLLKQNPNESPYFVIKDALEVAYEEKSLYSYHSEDRYWSTLDTFEKMGFTEGVDFLKRSDKNIVTGLIANKLLPSYIGYVTEKYMKTHELEDILGEFYEPLQQVIQSSKMIGE